MARLYLVRHGEAAAGFGEHDDPGLSAAGGAQAQAAAARLAALGLAAALVSPLLRCRETAAPFAALTGAALRIEPAIAEIPTPPTRRADRRAWLSDIMAGPWSAQPALAAWRAGVIQALAAVGEDVAVFSHFIAINVAVGAATGADQIINFWPANGSITVLDTAPGGLRLVSLGAQSGQGRVL